MSRPWTSILLRVNHFCEKCHIKSTWPFLYFLIKCALNFLSIKLLLTIAWGTLIFPCLRLRKKNELLFNLWGESKVQLPIHMQPKKKYDYLLFNLPGKPTITCSRLDFNEAVSSTICLAAGMSSWATPEAAKDTGLGIRPEMRITTP